MNLLIQLKTIPQLLITLTLLCFGLPQRAQAVVPPPDGGYPGFTTAEGTQALQSLTTGAGNTGVGFRALFADTTGSFNTGLGAGALLLNQADSNTAVGAVALLLNTTGSQNTAVGATALLNNTGSNNTAVGISALRSNTSGPANTALGVSALSSNTIGNNNTAIGNSAINQNTTGSNNTAIGSGTLPNNTGSFNIALGQGAGFAVSTADDVICIGATGQNVSNTCYIGNIFGVTSSGGTGVFVNSAGKLGTVASAARFKTDIKPMDKASEAILALKPVTFRYKQDIDPDRRAQFGLVAEDVEKVDPDLVVRDAEGKVNTVRYEAVNAMLLNEFLKEHCKVEQLKNEFEATVAQQQKEIQALTAQLKAQAAQIQKVSAQIEVTKPAQPLASNYY